MNKLKKINTGMCVRICTENNLAISRNPKKYLTDVIILKCVHFSDTNRLTYTFLRK